MTVGPTWDCVCGARGNAVAYCPFCGRQAPPYPGQPVHYYQQWPQRPPPTPPLLSPLMAVIATLIGAVLFVGVVAVYDRSEWGSPSSAPTVTYSPTPPPVGLDAAIAEARAFVSSYRGGPFREDVPVRLLGDEAFERALNGGSDSTDADTEPGDEGEDFASTLRGLRLADADEDPDEAGAFLDDTVVGFYDDTNKQLYVRGRDITPYARLVLVHEFTHAWQDQRFDLAKLDATVDTADEDLALSSLVEGDAVRTEEAWRRNQPKDVRDAIDAVENGGGDGENDDLSKAEEVLARLSSFPYDAGVDFVNALARKGGNQEVDKAFADPPRSSAQILHPERYLARDEPAPVPEPSAGGTVLDKGSLGEVGLVLVAGQGGVDEDSLAAAEGWDGDAYVTWTGGPDGTVCTTAVVAMHDRRQRDELARALRKHRWGRRGSVTPEGDRNVRLVSCSA